MIWVGALEEGYNSFAGTVSASGNTNESGEAVEPSIVTVAISASSSPCVYTMMKRKKRILFR